MKKPPLRHSSLKDSLWNCWLRTVQKKSKKIVLTEAITGARWTAQELTETALQRASRLSSCAGHTVAFCLPNSAEWFAVFLALQKIGAAALPLDSSLPPQAWKETARRLGAHDLWRGEKIEHLKRASLPPPDICCVKTTSGTTGQSQPLFCATKNLLADGKNIIATMKIRANDVNLGLIPLGHSYGIGNLVMPLLLQGTAIICADRFVPRQIHEWIQKFGATAFPSVPTVFEMLAQLPSAARLHPLRLAISAGAPLAAKTARLFYKKYGVKIHNFYGSSETGGICYDRSGNASLSGRSVGKPLKNVRVKLLKNRVVVKSQAVVAAGSQITLADLGEWNSRGELRLVGRAEPVANIGGKKASPAEIETAIRRIRGVSDAWVSVIRQKSRDYFAAAVETNLSRDVLEKKLAKKIAPWKMPRHWHTALELPRTPRGKLDTTTLRGFLDQ
ncbi:MAG: class I adenylate-forming enzyme family protein [bacterium]